MIKLPWRHAAQKDRVVVACSPDHFAYVQAQVGSGLPRRVARWGVERRGDDSPADFARRVRALGLPGRQAVAVLALPQYQLLQIESPNVPPAELKAAARWHIKDMIDVHLDDLTLDVLRVGDERPRGQKHLFVIAAANTAIQETTALAAAAGLQLSVIDIRETAQRNLQCAAARAAGLAQRATAALMVHGTQCVLTISAGEELFYTRRLEWDEHIVAAALGARQAAPPEEPGFDAVPVHTLDYGKGDSYDAASSLVVELQRSFDVWERSWSDLPLASLTLQAPGHAGAIAALLQRELGLHVEALDETALFGGFDAADAASHAACLPLLGALLRTEQRKP